jgi:hypothetical protein
LSELLHQPVQKGALPGPGRSRESYDVGLSRVGEEVLHGGPGLVEAVFQVADEACGGPYVSVADLFDLSVRHLRPWASVGPEPLDDLVQGGPGREDLRNALVTEVLEVLFRVIPPPRP